MLKIKETESGKLNRILLTITNDVSEKTFRAMEIFGKAVTADAMKNLKSEKRVVSGALLNSITYKMARLKNSIRLIVGANAKSKKTEGSSKFGYAYGQVVENGLDGNFPFPPTSAIVEWMKEKGIKPKYRERNTKGQFKKIPIERRYEKSAYAIARHISEFGFESDGDEFLKDAIHKNLRILDNKLTNLVR